MKAYMAKVSGGVQKKWLKNMPRAAREGERGFIRLQVTIQADGSIPEDSLHFRTVFADDSLMEKALTAVREAGPFPPFPPDFQKTFLTSGFVFLYNLPRQPPGCR
jgi:TonB family protein